MAEFERIEVGRHVLGPGDMLLIRVKSGTSPMAISEFKAAIVADGRLSADRVMIMAAEQFVIVRNDEKAVHVA